MTAPSIVEFYYMPESIYYGTSLLREGVSDRTAFEYRLNAMADFLECLVLSDRLVYDAGDAPLDGTILDVMSEFDLDEIVVSRGFGGVSFENLVPQLNSEIKTVLPDFDGNRFAHAVMDYSSWQEEGVVEQIQTLAESMAPMFDDRYFGSNYDSIIDFLRLMGAGAGISFEDIATQAGFDYGGETWDDAFAMIESKKFPEDELNSIVSYLFFWFTLISESALTTSLRSGIPYYPYRLHGEMMLSRLFFSPSSRVFMGRLTEEKYRNFAKLNDYIYQNHARVINFPIIFNYLLSKAESMEDLFRIALDLRSGGETRRYRLWCSDLDQELAQGNQENALSLIEEADRFIGEISKITREESQVDIQISFPPAAIFPLSVLSEKMRRKNHLMFLKRVYRGSKSPLFAMEKAAKLFGFRY